MFIAMRVILLSQDAPLARRLKVALEDTRNFAVSTFASLENALEALTEHPFDAIVVDVRDFASFTILQDQLRLLNITAGLIILTDKPAEFRVRAPQVGVFTVLPTTVRARELAEACTDAIQQARLVRGDTARGIRQTPISGMDPVKEDTDRMAALDRPLASVDFIVTEDATTGETVLQQTGDYQSDSIFERLASEEPPLPEDATVRDLMDASRRAERIAFPADLGGETVQTADDQMIPAALILANAATDSTPLEGFSLAKFLTRVQEQLGTQAVQPLPSWIEDADRFVREPDFLPDMLPGFDEPLEYTAPTTVPSAATYIEIEPGELVTERQEPPPRQTSATAGVAEHTASDDESAPAPSAAVARPDDFGPLPDFETPDWDDPAPDFEPSEDAEPARIPEPPVVAPVPDPPQEAEWPQLDGQTIGEADTDEVPALAGSVAIRDVTILDQDEEIVRIAATMTQYSLELTASATVLTRSGRVVAVAGDMPLPDIEQVFASFGENWDDVALQGRIRYATVASSGRDYMVYLTSTQGGLTLSLLFAGTQKVTAIRRQGLRLAEALERVPEPVAPEPEVVEEELPVAPEIDWGPRTAYTYVWLVGSAQISLAEATRARLQRQLPRRLSQEGWQVQSLEVQEDVITLRADVPGTSPASVHWRRLAATSAEIIRAQQFDLPPDPLWSDSYLALTPGRDLAPEEIQRFIGFVNM